MKNSFYALGVSIALTAACQFRSNNDLLFSTPQPQSEENLNAFPNELLGRYTHSGDSVELRIEPRTMSISRVRRVECAVASLDSGLVLIGDTLLQDKEARRLIPVKRLNDSVYGSFEEIDTLFTIDNDHILRQLHHAYILNTREEDSWGVQKLEKKNKFLTLSSVEDSEAGLLKSLSENYSDSIPYNFNISRSNLKKFIKANGFRSVDTFKLTAKSRPVLPFLINK